MFTLEKGINLSHWLSQVFGWSPREKFITETDIKTIKSLGFDHVRLPVDEEELWDTEGNKIDSAWQYMTDCIDWCVNNDLRVVIDMHILRSHHFNAANNEGAMTLWTDVAAQDNFLDLWTQLSEVLKPYSTDMLAYELMNEPVAPEHDMWNKLLARLHAHVRALEPDRMLSFGSNRWQFPSFYPYLEIPEGDKNIILSIHTYDPLLITHYRAYWLPIETYTGPVSYPGMCISPEDYDKYTDKANKAQLDFIEEHNRHFDKAELIRVMQPAIDKAKKLGLKLYCSEFGCLPSIPQEMRMQYYQDMISIFKENNIAFCHWDLKGDFGIMEWDKKNYTSGSVHKDVVDVLIG